MTRSSRLLFAGVVVLVLGLVVAVLALQQGGDPIVVNDTDPLATTDTSTTEEDADAAPSGAVGDLGDDEFRLPLPLEIPEGDEAVAVSVDYQGAVAAIPVPGDTVNLYALFTDGVPDELVPADELAEVLAAEEEGDLSLRPREGVIRVLDAVEVLGATGVEPVAGGGQVTLLLSLSPADAERVIFLAGTERVWFSLVGPDHEPVEGEGVTLDSVLDEPAS